MNAESDFSRETSARVASNQRANVSFIGVGNRYRRDDGVGPEMVERLAARRLPQTRSLHATGEGAKLLEMMKGREVVYLFDAVCSGARPGSIFRFQAPKQTVPARFFSYSTHAFSVAEAIELGRTLNQLPRQLIVYGIEGEDFGAGLGLSKEVEISVDGVVKSVLAELGALGKAGSDQGHFISCGRME
ncbi:MAG: hydrogenase maturation protease [bacterium]